MRSKSIISIIVVVTGFFVTSVSSGSYTIIDLGTLGGDISIASSINNNGQVVGEAFGASGFRATLFDSTGAGAIDPTNNTDLGTAGGSESSGSSINGSGEIVGDAQIDSGLWRATRFDSTGDGNNISLGTLGGDNSWASCINDSGWIVGRAQIVSGDDRATLYDSTGDGNNINLGTLGGNYSEAISINDAVEFQIVGFALTALGDIRATLFDSTGAGASDPSKNTDLGTLGGSFSEALAINDLGQIVGYAGTISEAKHATLFDSTGDVNNIDLGGLGYWSEAEGINNLGQIVGSAGTTSSEDDKHAILFDSSGGGNNVDLNNLIDQGLGWTLTRAININDDGWIVGIGVNPDGYSHAFLLTPEPATVLLFGLGAVMLRRRCC